MGKIATATVQSTATDGFIFTTDVGDLGAYGVLKTVVISDVPAFSGSDFKAIAIGQSARHE